MQSFEANGEGAGGNEIGVAEGMFEGEVDLRVRIGIRILPSGCEGRSWGRWCVVRVGIRWGVLRVRERRQPTSLQTKLFVVYDKLIRFEGGRSYCYC